jgi:3-deoxy-7-phosphoheptulonate synthase
MLIETSCLEAQSILRNFFHREGTRFHEVRHEAQTFFVLSKTASPQLPQANFVLKRIQAPYPLVSRERIPQGSVVAVGTERFGTVSFGQGSFPVIAGPCSVETEDQILRSAEAIRSAGGQLLRGGAFKPRTSPYEFQGLGEEGLQLLARAREESGLPVVTEVLAEADVCLVAAYADVLQVGARNMQNYALLKALGKAGRPVLLKRGLSATFQEFLFAAEYIAAHGNPQIILCERGIRTFEQHNRNTCDIAAVPALQELTHLPVILDPSHATGRRSLVTPLAKAAVAVGADGLLVECHPNPERAWSDGAQSLNLDEFHALMESLSPLLALRASTILKG